MSEPIVTAESFAESEGATISHGINWSWANGFPTQPAAARFLAWLERNGREYRGIYYQGEDKNKWDVRYR